MCTSHLASGASHVTSKVECGYRVPIGADGLVTGPVQKLPKRLPRFEMLENMG